MAVIVKEGTKNLGKKIWEYSGWFVAAYTVYQHVKTLAAAKDEFYLNMEPSQQARWDAIFGKPKVAALPSPMLAPPLATVAKKVPPTLTQVVSGT